MISSEQTPQVDPQDSGGLTLLGHRVPSSTSHSPPPSPGPQGGAGVGGQEVPYHSEKVRTLPTQLRVEVPASWEAFAGG